MRLAALIAGAAALSGSTHTPLSERDFQQLMQDAVAASASSWAPSIQTVCVQRELESPLRFVKEPIGLAWMAPAGSAKTIELDRSVAAAMSSTTDVELSKTMPPLSGRFVMFSAKEPKPAVCVIEHGPGAKETAIALTFTRPAFANGLAFINEAEDCPGLCGNGILWAFKKQNGKWTQVGEAILWVS